MQLVAEAGVGVLTRGDIEELNVDDVFIPDGCQLRRGADGFTGPALLRFQDGHQGYFALTSNGRELRYQEPKLIEEPTMTDDKPHRQAVLNQDALDKIVSLGRDAPVSITVELARFTLPLEDVAALQPGDIFNTHAPIGAQVTLRAAGVPIALGELIDIEGETGVRVVEVK